MKKHSKFLLFLPSIVTLLNLDSDKESSSRKKTTSKGKMNNNSNVTILSTGNMNILMIQERRGRGSAGFF